MSGAMLQHSPPTHHINTRHVLIGVIVCTLMHTMFIIYISMQLYTLIYTRDVISYISMPRCWTGACAVHGHESNAAQRFRDDYDVPTHVTPNAFTWQDFEMGGRAFWDSVLCQDMAFMRGIPNMVAYWRARPYSCGRTSDRRSRA